MIEDLAQKYLNGQITGPDYAAMQAAAFIRPRSQDSHQKRRNTFRQRVAEAEADGFVIPGIFRELVETDAYVDRLHHNTIWLQMPEELWQLPSDRSLLVFLASRKARMLQLALVVSERRVSFHGICEYPFGLRSIWPGSLPTIAMDCGSMRWLD